MSSRPKSPTRQQLSSRLAYEKKIPNFLLRLQNKVNGISNDDDDDEYGYREREAGGGYDGDDNYGGDEFEYVNDGSGRPPIPVRPRERPAIPERPADDPGSADEDDVEKDELPQVVVLKAGKHLTEWEAENVKRKEKGLPPLPNPDLKDLNPNLQDESAKSQSKKIKDKSHSLSFSSGPSSSSKPSSSSFKRKILGDAEDRLETESTKESKPKKKAKKNNKSKTLLSFGDDA